MEADDFLVIAENLTIVYRREVRFFGKAVQNGSATLRAETASGSIVLAGPFSVGVIDNILVALANDLVAEKPVINMRDLIDRSATKITVAPRDQRTVVAVRACG